MSEHEQGELFGRRSDGTGFLVTATRWRGYEARCERCNAILATTCLTKLEALTEAAATAHECRRVEQSTEIPY